MIDTVGNADDQSGETKHLGFVDDGGRAVRHDFLSADDGLWHAGRGDDGLAIFEGKPVFADRDAWEVTTRVPSPNESVRAVGFTFAFEGVD